MVGIEDRYIAICRCCRKVVGRLKTPVRLGGDVLSQNKQRAHAVEEEESKDKSAIPPKNDLDRSKIDR